MTDLLYFLRVPPGNPPVIDGRRTYRLPADAPLPSSVQWTDVESWSLWMGVQTIVVRVQADDPEHRP